MSYVALYRKFRPQTFAQVKGQEAVVRTLQNQIKNNRIGHAYLFTGTRGTGKTSVAKIFAKAVNCLNPHDGEPCNECENCRAVTNGNFIDVVEIDAASNTGVDDIRRVIEEIRYTPVYGRHKVYIIDEVHMLSTSASNAFLKTLEEPPEYAIFILATTDPQKLPVTILSRCQRYDFRRITSDEIAGNIKELLKAEGVEAEEKAVRYVAQAGDGSMRDALSLLDKAIAFTMGETLTYEAALKALGTVDSEVFSKVFRCAAAGDAFGAISGFDEAVSSGKAIGQFVSDFIWYLRNLMLISLSGGKESEVLGLSDDSLKILEADAKLADTATVVRYIEVLSSLANTLKVQASKQAACEIALIKLAKPQMETDMSALLDRVRQLEKQSEIKPAVQPIQPNDVLQHAAATGFNDYPANNTQTDGFSQNQNQFDVNFFDANIPEQENSEETQTDDIPEGQSQFDTSAFNINKTEQESSEENIFNDDNSGQQISDGARCSADITEKTEPEERLSDGNIQKHEKPDEEKKYTPAFLVQANWKEVVGNCTHFLNKGHLAEAEVEPLGEDLIRITIQNKFGFQLIDQWKEELKELIKKTTGCDVSLSLVSGPVAEPTLKRQQPAGTQVKAEIQPEPEPEYEPDYDEQRIEQLLKENVMMSIEEEA